MKTIRPINAISCGLCPSLTARYAQGFALSSAAEKSEFFKCGNPNLGSRNNVRCAILEIYGDEEDKTDKCDR